VKGALRTKFLIALQVCSSCFVAAYRLGICIEQLPSGDAVLGYSIARLMLLWQTLLVADDTVLGQHSSDVLSAVSDYPCWAVVLAAAFEHIRCRFAHCNGQAEL
jgi:hypothetical protein